MSPATFVKLAPGDPAPWFTAASTSRPDYAFDTAAGRYLLLCFYGSTADPLSRAALHAVASDRGLFDDARLSFFAVSNDPADQAQNRIKASLPGIRIFWDFDGAVSRAYGALAGNGQAQGGLPQRRLWIVLGPDLRVLRVLPFAADGTEQAELFAFLEALPPLGQVAGIVVQAPVLFLPNVFEPELCATLISQYERAGGVESGYMIEADGKTVRAYDAKRKRRKDHEIADPALRATIMGRFTRRIVPEITKAFQFRTTRIERYIVGCYSAEDGGHFRPHRDNTTKGTAHRRFAVSINLNADFEGGELSFPEYGPRGFKPPPGGAVVFSC